MAQMTQAMKDALAEAYAEHMALGQAVQKAVLDMGKFVSGEDFVLGPKPAEPVRQIVRAPDNRLWLLDPLAGRVLRGITLDEIADWGTEGPKPVVVGGVLTGPRWEMRNRTWTQLVKLAACTCGVTPGEEHLEGCCLIAILAGKAHDPAWPESP